MDLQSVTCEILLEDGKDLIYTAVYASNDEEERKKLWCSLRTTEANFGLSYRSWMVNGDFNEILYPAETSNASIVCSTRGMRLFGDCLADLGLFDLPFSGPQFTWTNKRSIDPTRKKLDRCLANGHWLSMFPSSHCTFEAPEFSDHSPCFIQLVTPPPSYALVQVGVPVYTLKDFCFKLKKMKGPMKSLMRDNFCDLEKRVVEAHSNLVALQLLALNDPSPVNLQNELLAKDGWMHLSLAEEGFFKQKSRLTWLGEGDFNTSFFHKVSMARNAGNAIKLLLKPDGSATSSLKEVHELVVDHFAEILQTIKGPDGFPAEFFKSTWSIIGQDLTMGVQQFFLDSFLPSALNSTSLILIPKIPGTVDVRDFRPISCLNTTYKIISRLLLDRLKILLPDLILPNQTAFIKDRLLLENVLLASEVVQGYPLASGFFKGKTGLRQGDPLSPILIVMIMNVLSLTLNKAAEEGSFSYHPGCEDLKLTHLRFADDLLIFLEGSEHSLRGVMSILSDFEEMSGLGMNIEKTSMFCSGLSESSLERLHLLFNLKHVSLPVRKKLNSWTHKFLSLAGRLTLISSVISGIIGFWTSAFFLPKQVIKRINSLCSSFLWRGKIDSPSGVKVSWYDICFPKLEGGLGLRNIGSWNETCALKLIWMLFFRAGSLWVAWIRSKYFSKSPLWALNEKNIAYSWNFRKLLKLHPLAL
ncbi:PREDICTED: uncharacterized protein LOC109127222 [Camelina sativa]|uniref:Uncharacterized protein LOC109127222 n=1 Tax=Camelina sativa TaxID=90675 RepID=A0ABM1QKK6_CAMSA|nr:PREDICTED: uncharacterized protein LOC109127222 [Camelina sativa]